MTDFQKKVQEKINLYSKKTYLNGYMEDEYTISNGFADVYLYVTEIEELYDTRTMGKQLDLRPDIYEYVENKTSMLDNDIQIRLHIVGYDVDSKEANTIKHIFKEHYAIELYKAQKNYKNSLTKTIGLLLFAVLVTAMYFVLLKFTDLSFTAEFLSVIFSFTIWEAISRFIFELPELNNTREAVTQNLLIDISFNTIIEHENHKEDKKEDK